MITNKQKELIDSMNEFCTKCFAYNKQTTPAQASVYIAENIEEYKLKTMSDWELSYL